MNKVKIGLCILAAVVGIESIVLVVYSINKHNKVVEEACATGVISPSMQEKDLQRIWDSAEYEGARFIVTEDGEMILPEIEPAEADGGHPMIDPYSTKDIDPDIKAECEEFCDTIWATHNQAFDPSQNTILAGDCFEWTMDGTILRWKWRAKYADIEVWYSLDTSFDEAEIMCNNEPYNKFGSDYPVVVWSPSLYRGTEDQYHYMKGVLHGSYYAYERDGKVILEALDGTQWYYDKDERLWHNITTGETEMLWEDRVWN